MTEKELRHLGRKELLEILLNQTKEITALRDRVQDLESQLQEKRIAVSESGSLAEASLKLNGLFADADKAAKQYLANAAQNEEESRLILKDAQKKAREIIAEAEEIRKVRICEVAQYVNRVKSEVKNYLSRYPELRSIADEEEQKK